VQFSFFETLQEISNDHITRSRYQTFGSAIAPWGCTKRTELLDANLWKDKHSHDWLF